MIGIGLSLSFPTFRLIDSIEAYAANGFSPSYVSSYLNQKYYVDGEETTFSGANSFSRASAATYLDSAGAIQIAASGSPRLNAHYWNGTTYVNGGLRFDSAAATNILLNSGTLSTQTVTTSATPYTLHFTGTGTVTLSGTSTAGPLVGTGVGENNRVSLTFTPTAGALTLTVTGAVTNAQLETGSIPTSYIPTAGATATRAAETLNVLAANLPAPISGYSISTKGLFAHRDASYSSTFISWTINANNRISISADGTGAAIGRAAFIFGDTAGTDLLFGPDGLFSVGVNKPFSLAGRFTGAEFNGAANGTAYTKNTSVTALPDLTATNMAVCTAFNGFISENIVWGEDIGDAGIAEAST